MTMEQLFRKCETLNKEFNTAARTMDGGELSAFRKKLSFKHDIGFENGWTVRMCRHVSDVFIVEEAQVWTRTEKGLFGKLHSRQTLRLTLHSPQIPELQIRCITACADKPEPGASLHICGELEVSAFLRGEVLQWKAGEFGKRTKITPAERPT